MWAPYWLYQPCVYVGFWVYWLFGIVNGGYTLASVGVGDQAAAHLAMDASRISSNKLE